MATINQFEDLQSWQEARILWHVIHNAIIKNESINDNSLKNQINELKEQSLLSKK